METTETTTPTPAPKKKSLGSILLIIALVGAILYFGGRYVCGLGKCTSSADSTLVQKPVIDSVDKKAVVALKDTVKAIAADTTGKVIAPKK